MENDERYQRAKRRGLRDCHDPGGPERAEGSHLQLLGFYGHWMMPCAHKQPPQAGQALPRQSSRLASAISQLLQVVQGEKSKDWIFSLKAR